MSDWSHAEDLKILKMWCAYDPPMSVREIADDLERSKSSVYRRITTLGLRGHQGDREKYEAETGVALEPVMRPVRIDMPEVQPAAPLPSTYTTLVWGDVQYPFEDSAAVNVLYEITEDLKPEMLVCLGDLFDFYELSDFRAEKDVPDDLQDTVNRGVEHLAIMRSLAAPGVTAYFLGGNHEDRWDRLFERTRQDVRWRQLLKLPKVRRALEFAEIVGFEDLGYEYRPYVGGEELILNDTLVIAHGRHATTYEARHTMERYGMSTIFGHTHRIQSFTKRDLKGQEAGWNIGCLCLLKRDFRPLNNWAHGFAVVTWHEHEGDWLYNVEQVRIHDGIAIFRDKVYCGY